MADVEGLTKELCRGRRALALCTAAGTPEQELFAQVTDSDGHILTLWRELSEDEYGYVPELPKRAVLVTGGRGVNREVAAQERAGAVPGAGALARRQER